MNLGEGGTVVAVATNAERVDGEDEGASEVPDQAADGEQAVDDERTADDARAADGEQEPTA
jgi:hypothetical protein